MKRQTLYERIELQPEAVRRLAEAEKTVCLVHLEPYLERLTEFTTAESAYQALLEYLYADADGFRMLLCQLECAGRVFARYRQKQIPEAIFTDTMKCFPRFLEECREWTGQWSFDRGWWTWRQLSMRLFRLGALEYELRKEAGERTVALHIPSDADLSQEAVDASLSQAAAFLSRFYPEYENAGFTCGSWLLAPALAPLLPENSQIAAFQRRFALLGEKREDMGFMQWLFRVPQDAPWDTLPENTRLQRSVKQFLLAGGKLGAGYGILRKVAPPAPAAR